MNQQLGKCESCLDDGLPCGPYQTAGETREFLKKAVADLHTVNGQINQRTATGFNLNDGQPTTSEPQSHNAGLPNASFVPQNSSLNVFEGSQLSTTLQPSQETVGSPVSGIRPTSATFTGSSVPQEADFDLLDEYTNQFSDLGPVEPQSSEHQSYHVEEEDPAVLSM